jgi:hypothetical protein
MTSARRSQSSRRIVLISDQSPLSLGVEDMLRDKVVLEVIDGVDPSLILDRVHAFRPDAVVLGFACETDESVSEWLGLVSDVPGTLLVTLSLRDNCVRVYDRGRMQRVPDAASLLDVFRLTRE